MSIIWRKVWRDLWLNKLRTVLVVLSTAAGVFALGLIFGMSGVMRTRFTESHQASVAPHIVFFTSRFRQDVVDATLREPGVVDAEGESRTSFRWKLPGDQDWRDGTLIASGDYDAQHMYLVDLLQGEWPAERTLAVERMSSEYYDLPLGTTILTEVGRRERSVSVDGIARHPWTPPPQLGMGDATFCATLETAAWLTGEEEGFNMLKVRLESFSEEGATAVAERIESRLTRIGLEVWGYEVIDPDVHWAQEMMDAIMLILGVLGVLALGLGGFLIINMMNATIAQQVWQIGVMKVVGATGWRVARVYLTMASVYGLLALFIAVPLGGIAAHLLAGWLLDLFNIPVGELSLTPAAVTIQVSVGLVVPLLAALVPVISGARITPHQAISSYGLAAGFGGNWLDRLIVGLRQLPRPLALSLRNTFRRKARIALTLLTLVLGGVMFLVVLSLSASMSNTLNLLLDDFGFDVYASLDRAYRVSRVVDVAMSVPGVVVAEVWNHRGAEIALSGGDERSIFLQGVPHASAIYSPRIIDGRGFLPEDDRAVLLNNKIATDGGFGVGDEVALTIEGRESVWTVVGLIINVNNDQRDSIVPFDALARETGSVHRGSSVWITAEEHNAAAQEALIRDLRDAYAKNRMEVAHFDSAEEVRQMNQSQFDIITYLMLVMSVLAAIVGSIGLMSTMSINVVERGREIGVMRAIGATSAIIAGIFVAEGLLIGLLSWLLALPLSYPGARAFSSLVGGTLFQLPLDFRYPASSILLWLAIVATLSMVASLWPALKATKVSVRVALAYE
jgi:putative ABC transport system permease protein